MPNTISIMDNVMTSFMIKYVNCIQNSTYKRSLVLTSLQFFFDLLICSIICSPVR